MSLWDRLWRRPGKGHPSIHGNTRTLTGPDEVYIKVGCLEIVKTGGDVTRYFWNGEEVPTDITKIELAIEPGPGVYFHIETKESQ